MMECICIAIAVVTTKKIKIGEGNLERENVKSLSNSVTKICNQEIRYGFYFCPSLISLLNFAFSRSVLVK